MKKIPYMKYIKDNKVAVIISPGYGSGWSTWAAPEYREYLIFDMELAKLILGGKQEEAKKIVKEKYPEVYVGSQVLTVTWVDCGEKFLIREYDGSESIEFFYGESYYAA
jgi:hypothetical protein